MATTNQKATTKKQGWRQNKLKATTKTSTKRQTRIGRRNNNDGDTENRRQQTKTRMATQDIRMPTNKNRRRQTQQDWRPTKKQKATTKTRIATNKSSLARPAQKTVFLFLLHMGLHRFRVPVYTDTWWAKSRPNQTGSDNAIRLPTSSNRIALFSSGSVPGYTMTDQ